MPRISRGERCKRAKAFKAEGGGSNDDGSSSSAGVVAQAKSNHDIASLHNKPKAGKSADPATGTAKKGSRRPPALAASSVSASSPGDGDSADVGKKRPRSENWEARHGSPEAPLGEVDQLVATIEKHDRFFSTMLDMIPEHLVLPAKEVPVSSYASKYMKVRFIG